MKAQRVVWGETLAELAASDDRVVVLDGDLATSTRSDLVATAVPDAFVQVGIAEQNMVGMAVGLSTLGYRPGSRRSACSSRTAHSTRSACSCRRRAHPCGLRRPTAAC